MMALEVEPRNSGSGRPRSKLSLLLAPPVSMSSPHRSGSRYEAAACAVQGQRAGRQRPAGQRRESVVRHAHGARATNPRRQGRLALGISHWDSGPESMPVARKGGIRIMVLLGEADLPWL